MIDIDTHIRLRNEYSPEDSPLRKHQLAMLEILKYIDNICLDNDITYWLSSGSCLGAVRHGGFIPWDDDVDIEMMREDYLKFLKVFKSNDQYVLQTYKNDLFYFSVFAKVRNRNTIIYDSLYKYRGIFVDVFALEYTNNALALLAEKMRKPFSWHFYRFIKKYRANRFIYFSCVPFFVLFKYLYFTTLPLFRVITKILPNNQLRHMYGVGWVKNVRVAEEIIKPIRIPFEGIMLPVPKHYDQYLTRIYGKDYMLIPPKESIPRGHVEFFDS